MRPETTDVTRKPCKTPSRRETGCNLRATQELDRGAEGDLMPTPGPTTVLTRKP